MNFLKTISTILIILSLGLRSLSADEEMSLRGKSRLETGYSGVAHIIDSSVTIYLTHSSKLDKVAYILSGNATVDYKDNIFRVNFNTPDHAYNVRLLWPIKENNGIVTPSQMIELKVQMPEGLKRDNIKKVEFIFTEIVIPIENGIKTKKITITCVIAEKSEK
jgi:hypothetical protein